MHRIHTSSLTMIHTLLRCTWECRSLYFTLSLRRLPNSHHLKSSLEVCGCTYNVTRSGEGLASFHLHNQAFNVATPAHGTLQVWLLARIQLHGAWEHYIANLGLVVLANA
jgi:hypothetical protein